MATTRKRNAGRRPPPVRLQSTQPALVWPAVLLALLLVLTWSFAALKQNGVIDLEFSDLDSVGLIGWLIIGAATQHLIDGHHFKVYGLITGVFGGGCLLALRSAAGYHVEQTAFLPLLHVGWLRAMLWLFFPSYPGKSSKPVFVSGPTSWKGKAGGYVPTVRERWFSLVVLFGGISIAVVVWRLASKL